MQSISRFGAVMVAGIVASTACAGIVEAKRIKLNVWTWSTGVYHDRLVEGGKQYSKRNPNIEIIVTSMGEINQKMKVALASGTGPDITAVNGSIIEPYNMKFMLKPLDSYLKTSKSADKYVKQALENQTIDGHVYALPWAVDANFPIVYNRDAFAEVGLPDRMAVTPEELLEFCRKLTKKDDKGKLTRVGMVPWDWEQNSLFNWALAFGPGQMSDGVRWKFTGENTMKALDFYVRLANACGGAAALDAFMQPLKWKPTVKAFTIRPQVVPQIYDIVKAEKNLRLGVGSFPSTPQGVNSVWLAGHGLGIGVRCKNPKEAFDFLRWFTLDMQVQKANSDFYFSGAKAAYEPKNLYEEGPKSDPMTPLLSFAASLVPKGMKKVDALMRDDDLFGKLLKEAVVKQVKSPLQAMREYEQVVNKRIDDKVGRMKGRITGK